MTKFIAAAKTQAGTNHPVNEDRLLLDGNVLCYGLVGDCEREMGCMAVFDGVSEGGHGAAASTLAAQAFAQAVRVFDTDAVNALQERLRMAGERAENDVETYAARYGLSVAASTVAGLVVAPDGHGAVFNAGDSRVYRLRGGVLAVLVAGGVQPLMPWFLSFAAGAMIYVVVEELIPEANLGEHSHSGTWGVLAGFVIMMVMDVALG